jgi:DNA-binding transcriptional ArsR family regulator
MTEVMRMAATAALLGDPARAHMLTALMGGGVLTAKELAFAAHISAPTASGHLAKLTEAGLLAAERHGRHRYYRLATPLVGAMVEGLLAVSGAEPPVRRWKGGAALRIARTCYDHLAGRLGVAVADGMVAVGRAVLTPDGGEITPAGLEFLGAFGADPMHGGNTRRLFCRPCLDWSERRFHLAGRVGAALCVRFFELQWIARQRDTRAVAITPAGREGFARTFGVSSEILGTSPQLSMPG